MEQELIYRLKQTEKSAQKEFYDLYAEKMFVIAFRYLNNEFDTGTAVNQAFLKALQNIKNFIYLGTGCLEAWLRKIVVNEALIILRSKKDVQFIRENDMLRIKNDSNPAENIEAEGILEMVCSLPSGYRTVFNLYVIEGYSHKEIGSMLSITESTSRSQLNRARILLQEIIKEKNYTL